MCKRLIYLLFAVLVVEASAQERNFQGPIESPLEYNFVLKTNPAPILWGPIPFTNEFRILNEFVVAPNQSTQIGVSYLGKSPFFSLLDPGNPAVQRIIVRGFRFQLSHRIFFNQIPREFGMYAPDYAPEGFYVGPLFSYSTARIIDGRVNMLYNRFLRINHTNINLVAGYQWINRRGFTFDLFTGFGYKENIWFEHNPPNITRVDMEELGPLYRSNLKLILGWNFGIAF